MINNVKTTWNKNNKNKKRKLTINTVSIFKQEITNAVLITLKTILGNSNEITADINIQMVLQLLSGAIMEMSHEFNQVGSAFLTILTKNLHILILEPKSW